MNAYEIPYEPPEREFSDTLLAFQDMQMASTWRVQVEPDPLGPVNSILTLMRGNYRVKSVLWPVPVGAKVNLGYESGSGRFSLWDFDWVGHQYYPPTWWVEVDGVRVIDVPESETYPPTPPAPTIPLRTRMRRVFREQVRADVDWVAGKFGFHRADDCEGWDE